MDLWGNFPICSVVGVGIGDTTVTFGIERVPGPYPVMHSMSNKFPNKNSKKKTRDAICWRMQKTCNQNANKSLYEVSAVFVFLQP